MTASPFPDGLLVVNKPMGWTSFDVIRFLRSRLNTRALGHTGTLDPRATGVLGVCIGWGRKLIQFLDDDHKVYRTVFRFGSTTTTDDTEGRITRCRPVSVSGDQLEGALSQLSGETLQRPPDFSAIKKNGKPAYKMARKGKPVELEPRPVRIDRIDLLSFSSPNVTLEVTCGKGTYIRSLARDIGEILGCGAHLRELVRVENGPLRLETALEPREIEELIHGGKPVPIVSPRQMLEHLPVADLSPERVHMLINGQKLPCHQDGDLRQGMFVRVERDEKELVAVAQVVLDSNEFRVLRPIRVRPQPSSSG